MDPRWKLSAGILAPLLVCLLPARADALTVLLSQINQSKVHTWNSANPGASVLLHSQQCNDADINVPEGSPHGWIAEHNTDHFGRFNIGAGVGLDAKYNLGQNGLTHYAYPKHITVYNGEVVVMSRNDGTLWRYSPAGAQLGSVKTAQNTGQGMATDGADLYVSLWTGAASSFVRYNGAFMVQQMFGNPTGMGNFNNIVDFVHDPVSGHFFGLATTGEGGTGTQSTTVLEFEMGGVVIKSYPLPFACDGIGSFVTVVCGDGKVEMGEACDDGNKVDTDACTNACKLAACGDGIVQDGVEACDDGNEVDEDACTTACEAAACGDGIVQEGVETCDDGNDVAEDTCTNACAPAVCGDATVQEGVESCDDGNEVEDDACSNACVAASCGDGVVQPGELCDDPNDPDCVDCMIVAGTTGDGTTGVGTTGDGTTMGDGTTGVVMTTGDATTGAGTTVDGTSGGESASGGATEGPTTGGTGSETTGTAASTGSTGGDADTDSGGGVSDDGCGCSSGAGDRGGLALLLLLGLARPRRRR